MIDQIHTVSKLSEVSREYKMPLCLTFIDLKAFDSVEKEAVVEALDNQGVLTQYIKRGVQQGDTVSPKIFTATLENAMRKLEWDDIISQAERMLTEFVETCGCIGLQLNLEKAMFMRNGWVSDAPFTLSGTNISECTSYVYLGAYKSIEGVVKGARNTRLRAHLFNTTVLPALTYVSEIWAFRKQEENAVSVIERATERAMLGVSRFTQVRDGIRSSLLRQRSNIRDAAAFAKEIKIRWAGHVMRFNDNRWTRSVSNWVPRELLSGLLSALQEDRRPDGQISSQSPEKKIMMFFVSHAKGGTTGLLWHAIGTNGRITGARSPCSKINGSQDDQGDIRQEHRS
ncbi:hypothetical protein RB195_014637 [Necator americanus]|uniref:Reverse transcriptase domain-containing protein n=1 Tax=Necator americanus TaxID=51031 RepID=A0ABR1E2P1_NECAM